MPLFSIIIPTYNKALTIEKTLDCVFKQSFNDYEIVIVDDGSTDGTQEIVRKYLTNNLKLICQKNAGPSAARNAGASNATGKYLIFLDADDEPYPFWLMKFESQNSYDVMFCGFDIFRLGVKDKTISSFDVHKLFNNKKGIFMAGTFAIKSDLFFSINGYDPSLFFGENFELGLRVFYHSAENRYGYISEPTLRINMEASDERNKKYLVKKTYGVLHTLRKHRDIFKRNKVNRITYLSILGYSFRQLAQFNKARKIYALLLKLKPFNPKFLFYYLICTLKTQ